MHLYSLLAERSMDKHWHYSHTHTDDVCKFPIKWNCLNERAGEWMAKNNFTFPFSFSLWLPSLAAGRSSLTNKHTKQAGMHTGSHTKRRRKCKLSKRNWVNRREVEQCVCVSVKRNEEKKDEKLPGMNTAVGRRGQQKKSKEGIVIIAGTAWCTDRQSLCQSFAGAGR